MAENATAVTTVTSADVDGGAPVFSIIGGADAAGMRTVWMTMHRRWDEGRYAPTASALTFIDAVRVVLDPRR